jgi:hypothetical protein
VKKFDALQIRRMAGRNGTPFVYKPFPGKHPVRLRVNILLRDDAARPGKWFNRFHYNGKWSYSILRKAIRIWKALSLCSAQHPNLLLSSEVTEYCQNGVLYYGDLFFGTYSQGHSMAHLFGRSSKGALRMNGEYLIEKLVPLRCDNFVLLVPEQSVRTAVTREQKNVLYREMRLVRKRWEVA